MLDIQKQLDLQPIYVAHYLRTIYFRGQLIPLCVQVEQKQWYVIYKEQYYYGEQFDDETILNTIDDWEQLREYLNDKYGLALSDLEIYEEL